MVSRGVSAHNCAKFNRNCLKFHGISWQELLLSRKIAGFHAAFLPLKKTLVQAAECEINIRPRLPAEGLKRIWIRSVFQSVVILYNQYLRRIHRAVSAIQGGYTAGGEISMPHMRQYLLK